MGNNIDINKIIGDMHKSVMTHEKDGKVYVGKFHYNKPSDECGGCGMPKYKCECDSAGEGLGDMVENVGGDWDSDIDVSVNVQFDGEQVEIEDENGNVVSTIKKAKDSISKARAKDSEVFDMVVVCDKFIEGFEIGVEYRCMHCSEHSYHVENMFGELVWIDKLFFKVVKK